MYEFVRDDDKLFRNDLPDLRNNVSLVWYFKQFSGYADGYRIAADNLLKNWLYDFESGRGDIDVLVYPIIFNYRHYVELRLKSILLKFREHTQNEDRSFNDHNIMKLWVEVKKSYKIFKEEQQNKHKPLNVTEYDDTDDFLNADRILTELHKIDESSFNFRYPLTKKGEDLLFNVEILNISNFGCVMERLANFLDSILEYMIRKMD